MARAAFASSWAALKFSSRTFAGGAGSEDWEAPVQRQPQTSAAWNLQTYFIYRHIAPAFVADSKMQLQCSTQFESIEKIRIETERWAKIDWILSHLSKLAEEICAD